MNENKQKKCQGNMKSKLNLFTGLIVHDSYNNNNSNNQDLLG